MKTKIERRTLIKGIGAASMALASGNHISAKGSIFKNDSSKVRLSLNAWSYNKELYKYINGEDGGMSLFDMLDECARLNLDAVDPTGYFFPGYPDAPSDQFIYRFKRRAFELGLAISGTGIRNDFATSDKSVREEGIDLAKRWINVAAKLGAPVIRVFAGKKPEGHHWDEAVEWLAEALQECANYGAQHGVIVGIQNHGGMLTTADEVLKLLAKVDSEWLGVILDTGYCLSDDPYEDIERIIPHTVNWQVKQLLKNRQGGKIDLEKLVEIIRKSNYRGYLPIETLAVPNQEENYDALSEVPIFLEELRKALG